MYKFLFVFVFAVEVIMCSKAPLDSIIQAYAENSERIDSEAVHCHQENSVWGDIATSLGRKNSRKNRVWLYMYWRGDRHNIRKLVDDHLRINSVPESSHISHDHAPKDVNEVMSSSGESVMDDTYTPISSSNEIFIRRDVKKNVLSLRTQTSSENRDFQNQNVNDSPQNESLSDHETDAIGPVKQIAHSESFADDIFMPISPSNEIFIKRDMAKDVIISRTGTSSEIHNLHNWNVNNNPQNESLSHQETDTSSPVKQSAHTGHNDSSQLDEGNSQENFTGNATPEGLHDRDSENTKIGRHIEQEIHNTYKFEITQEQWSLCSPHPVPYGENSRVRVRCNRAYANIMAKSFYQICPRCVLRFKHHYVKVDGSRKRKCPYFRASAECTFPKCRRKFLFSIQENPKDSKEISVLVHATGEALHQDDDGTITPRRRQQSNICRDEVALEAQGQSAVEYHYKKLGHVSANAFEWGNLTKAPGPAVIRKILSEMKMKEKIDDDMTKEVILLREVYIDEDMESKKIKGYIQYISVKPLCIHLYTEKQLDICHQFMRNGNGVFHVDATGKVVADMPDAKPTFYYAIVIKPDNLPPLPVAEMLANDHTTPTITHFLMRFLRDLQELHPKCLPAQIETDYSYAMINAACLAFNRLSLSRYLDDCWQNQSITGNSFVRGPGNSNSMQTPKTSGLSSVNSNSIPSKKEVTNSTLVTKQMAPNSSCVEFAHCAVKEMTNTSSTESEDDCKDGNHGTSRDLLTDVTLQVNKIDSMHSKNLTLSKKKTHEDSGGGMKRCKTRHEMMHCQSSQSHDHLNTSPSKMEVTRSRYVTKTMSPNAACVEVVHPEDNEKMLCHISKSANSPVVDKCAMSPNAACVEVVHPEDKDKMLGHISKSANSPVVDKCAMSPNAACVEVVHPEDKDKMLGHISKSANSPVVDKCAMSPNAACVEVVHPEDKDKMLGHISKSANSPVVDKCAMSPNAACVEVVHPEDKDKMLGHISKSANSPVVDKCAMSPNAACVEVVHPEDKDKMLGHISKSANSPVVDKCAMSPNAACVEVVHPEDKEKMLGHISKSANSPVVDKCAMSPNAACVEVVHPEDKDKMLGHISKSANSPVVDKCAMSPNAACVEVVHPEDKDKMLGHISKSANSPVVDKCAMSPNAACVEVVHPVDKEKMLGHISKSANSPVVDKCAMSPNAACVEVVHPEDKDKMLGHISKSANSPVVDKCAMSPNAACVEVVHPEDKDKMLGHISKSANSPVVDKCAMSPNAACVEVVHPEDKDKMLGHISKSANSPVVDKCAMSPNAACVEVVHPEDKDKMLGHISKSANSPVVDKCAMSPNAACVEVVHPEDKEKMLGHISKSANSPVVDKCAMSPNAACVEVVHPEDKDKMLGHISKSANSPVVDKCGQKANNDPHIINGPCVTTVSITRNRFVRTVEEPFCTKPVNASALSNDHPNTNLSETDVTNSKFSTNKIFINISCVGVSHMGSQKLMKMNGKDSDDDEKSKTLRVISSNVTIPMVKKLKYIHSGSATTSLKRKFVHEDGGDGSKKKARQDREDIAKSQCVGSKMSENTSCIEVVHPGDTERMHCHRSQSAYSPVMHKCAQKNEGNDYPLEMTVPGVMTVSITGNASVRTAQESCCTKAVKASVLSSDHNTILSDMDVTNSKCVTDKVTPSTSCVEVVHSRSRKMNQMSGSDSEKDEKNEEYKALKFFSNCATLQLEGKPNSMHNGNVTILLKRKSVEEGFGYGPKKKARQVIEDIAKSQCVGSKMSKNTSCVKVVRSEDKEMIHCNSSHSANSPVIHNCAQKKEGNDYLLKMNVPGVRDVSINRDTSVRTAEESGCTKPVTVITLSNDRHITIQSKMDVTNSKCVTKKMSQSISCVEVTHRGSKKMTQMNSKDSEEVEIDEKSMHTGKVTMLLKRKILHEDCGDGLKKKARQDSEDIAKSEFVGLKMFPNSSCVEVVPAEGKEMMHCRSSANSPVVDNCAQRKEAKDYPLVMNGPGVRNVSINRDSSVRTAEEPHCTKTVRASGLSDDHLNTSPSGMKVTNIRCVNKMSPNTSYVKVVHSKDKETILCHSSQSANSPAIHKYAQKKEGNDYPLTINVTGVRTVSITGNASVKTAEESRCTQPVKTRVLSNDLPNTFQSEMEVTNSRCVANQNPPNTSCVEVEHPLDKEMALCHSTQSAYSPLLDLCFQKREANDDTNRPDVRTVLITGNDFVWTTEESNLMKPVKASGLSSDCPETIPPEMEATYCKYVANKISKYISGVGVVHPDVNKMMFCHSSKLSRCPRTDHCVQKKEKTDDPLISNRPDKMQVLITGDDIVKAIEESHFTKNQKACGLLNDHPNTSPFEMEVTSSRCATNKISKNTSCVEVVHPEGKEMMLCHSSQSVSLPVVDKCSMKKAVKDYRLITNGPDVRAMSINRDSIVRNAEDSGGGRNKQAKQEKGNIAKYLASSNKTLRVKHRKKKEVNLKLAKKFRERLLIAAKQDGNDSSQSATSPVVDSHIQKLKRSDDPVCTDSSDLPTIRPVCVTNRKKRVRNASDTQSKSLLRIMESKSRKSENIVLISDGSSGSRLPKKSSSTARVIRPSTNVLKGRVQKISKHKKDPLLHVGMKSTVQYQIDSSTSVSSAASNGCKSKPVDGAPTADKPVSKSTCKVNETCKKTRSAIRPQNVVLHLCSMHVLRALSFQLRKQVQDRKLVKFIMYVFARMQCSPTLAEASYIFKHLVILCSSRCVTEATKESLDFLNDIIVTNSDIDITEHTEGETFSESVVYSTLYENSPYYQHFKGVLASHYVSDNGRCTDAISQHFAPSVPDMILKNYLHLYPIISGSQLPSADRWTNSAVELWMRLVKKGILNNKLRVRLSTFIRKVHGSLMGRCREFRGNGTTREMKKQKHNPDSLSQKEQWKKRCAEKKHSYFSTPKFAPQPKYGIPDDKIFKFHAHNFPQWGGNASVDGANIKMTNTCPLDNFMAIMRMLLSSKKFEVAFSQDWKRASLPNGIHIWINFLKKNEFHTAKAWWMKKILGFSSKTHVGKVWDCHGTENSRFVKFVAPIQSSILTKKCTLCPGSSRIITDICLE